MMDSVPPLLSGHSLGCHVGFSVRPDGAAAVGIHPFGIAAVSPMLAYFHFDPIRKGLQPGND